MATAKHGDRQMLMDVSRLVWRAWRGALPTGIDRVCLAYAEHYAAQSQAVVQYRGFQRILSRHDSGRLFSALLSDPPPTRRRLLALALPAIVRARKIAARPGAIYLNVGHTGLNEPSLPRWIAANKLRAVYMVHDLIPITHPRYCRPAEPAKHRKRMDNMLTSAAGIIGNSKASLDGLRDYSVNRGVAMPPTLAAWLGGWQPPSDITSRKLDRPYFVTVGTIEGRKNHILLLKIWKQLVAELGDDAPILVIIGQRGWQAEQTHAMLDRLKGAGGPVIELGSCADVELAGWLTGAQALLMPSFAEGFGLPVFEALGLGTPVIATDLPVYHEVAGDIPTYLGASDAAGWARAIRRASLPAAKGGRGKRAPQEFRAPDWADHFAKVDRWLAKL